MNENQLHPNDKEFLYLLASALLEASPCNDRAKEAARHIMEEAQLRVLMEGGVVTVGLPAQEKPRLSMARCRLDAFAPRFLKPWCQIWWEAFRGWVGKWWRVANRKMLKAMTGTPPAREWEKLTGVNLLEEPEFLEMRPHLSWETFEAFEAACGEMREGETLHPEAIRSSIMADLREMKDSIQAEAWGMKP